MQTFQQVANGAMRLVRQLGESWDDPITEYYGAHDVVAEAHRRTIERFWEENGWTYEQFEAELEKRVSAKWIYNSGLAELDLNLN